MANSQKEKIVKNINKKLEGTKSLVFTDYQRLSASQINTLRLVLKEVGGELKVVKNRLLEKASPNYSFTGPTAVVIAQEDPIAPLKALARFAQENRGLPKIKKGLLEGDWLSPEDLQTIANLPSRKELLAQVSRGMQGPLSNLISAIAGTRRKLISTLAEIVRQK